MRWNARFIPMIIGFMSAAWVLLGYVGPVQAGELRLLMFEERGCRWCMVWEEEIGGIYPRTAEGKRAPLHRIEVGTPLPADLESISPTRFTPTFVLVADGREVGRITGYPGEDFFWGLLENLIAAYDEERSAIN